MNLTRHHTLSSNVNDYISSESDDITLSYIFGNEQIRRDLCVHPEDVFCHTKNQENEKNE